MKTAKKSQTRPIYSDNVKLYEARLEKRVSEGFFLCAKPLEDRAPGCSGKGYGPGREDGTCSECANYARGTPS